MNAQSTSFLQVSGIEAIYGQAILAVRDVSLSVEAGQIVALLGANGAGKTTTLKAISNLLGPERGKIVAGGVSWKAEPIGRVPASKLVESGIVQVLEGRRCFPQLTVEENILSGGYVRRPGRAELARSLDQVYDWFPRLREKRRTKAGLTSGGAPSMGLAPIIVQEIFEIIRSLNRASGVSFLIAEQNANLALRYADYGYILETGHVVASGTATELLARDDVHEFYLGSGTAPATASGQGR